MEFEEQGFSNRVRVNSEGNNVHVLTGNDLLNILTGDDFVAAQLLAGVGFAPQLLARLAGDQTAIDRLLASTGSTIDQTGRQGYARLVRSPGHIAGALAMMANWDLEALARDLPRLETRLLLLAGANDLTVPPGQAVRVSRLVRGAALDLLPGLGHLAHEEQPALVADRITAFARDLGLNPASAAF